MLYAYLNVLFFLSSFGSRRSVYRDVLSGKKKQKTKQNEFFVENLLADTTKYIHVGDRYSRNVL